MDLRRNHVKDEASETCIWLVRDKKYENWLRRRQGLLWIKGKPGAGKSTLLNYALRKAKERQHQSKSNLVIASFFFHGRGAPIQKNSIGLFRSLLHQILDQIPELLSELTSIFEEKCEKRGVQGKGWEWHVAELEDFLKTSLPRIQEACPIEIYVDALDECSENVIKELVGYFQSLVTQLSCTKSSLMICFSCRHYPNILLEEGVSICVENENSQDIAAYVQGELKQGSFSKGDRKALEAGIEYRASGIFQWVVLVVLKVLKLDMEGKNMQYILNEIRKIPEELDSLYREILQSINDEDQLQSLQLMQWICFAERPLTLTQLRFAMMINAELVNAELANKEFPYSSLRECEDKSIFYSRTDEDMGRGVKSLSAGLAEVEHNSGGKLARLSINQSTII